MMEDTDSMQERHLEVLRSLQEKVAENLNLLGPVDKIWQPSDFLPDLTREDWREQIQQLRDAAEALTDEILVVLVGDMVTEEALPSYAVQLNHIVQDSEGDSPLPWAKWLRGWVAEENRHGDLLNAFLRLSGRVDMRSIEVTVQHLIAEGFNPRTYPDPYNGLVYTSFQERATKVSHNNVGKLAGSAGDASLARICQKIAGDESRHEAFYTRMMGHVMDADPEGGVMAFRRMIRGIISMPGRLMYDGHDPDLFDHFAVVAQRIGVYTVHDYAGILTHLVKTWDIASRPVTGQAARAQDYLCKQAERYVMLADEVSEHLAKQPKFGFKWIYDRKV
jgi:acyl-[acyl-carrier-protein] desaturase